MNNPDFQPPEYDTDMEEEYFPLFRDRVSDKVKQQFDRSWGPQGIGWEVVSGIAGAALTLVVLKAGKSFFKEEHGFDE